MHAGNHSLHPLGGRGGSEGGPSITLVAASNAPTCVHSPLPSGLDHTNVQEIMGESWVFSWKRG